MSQKVRWGILSTARHGLNTVIPAIQRSASADVVAIASRDAARARQVAQEHGIPASHSSYEALLADPGVDAVYIPLPNNLHKEWTIRAVRAGKHVLCEKPLALDAAEAAEMVAAARAAGRILAETFQWRHHPQAWRTRDLVRSGAIGELRFIEAGFSFSLNRPDDIRWDPALGGGALYDVGCYPIALLRYMTGQEPLRVTAQARRSASGVDDLLVATLEFPGGVLATLNCAFILPLRRYFEIVGSDGSVLVDHAYNPRDDTPQAIVRRGADRDVIETIALGAPDSYVLMAEDFNRAVLEGREPPFPAEDGVKNMRVIDAILRAAREGGTVTV